MLEDMGDLKGDYGEYMITEPINCDIELKRLPAADYELAIALLTMLFREDHFSNGSFERRQRIRRIEDKSSQPSLRRVFLEIDDDAFSSMEITLGPKVSEGCRIIAESLVKQYNPHCIIKNSSLKIK